MNDILNVWFIAITQTLLLAITSFFIGLLLTVCWVIGAQHLRFKFWIELILLSIRGLPEFSLLLILYFCMPYFAKQVIGIHWQPSSFWCGLITLSLVFSAYAYEVVQSANRSLPIEQAATLLGFNAWQQRRLIYLPQFWQHAKPGMINLWLVLLKDTAIVSLIGYNELLKITDRIAKCSENPLLFYGIAGLCYWFLCEFSRMSLSHLKLQKRLT